MNFILEQCYDAVLSLKSMAKVAHSHLLLVIYDHKCVFDRIYPNKVMLLFLAFHEPRAKVGH